MSSLSSAFDWARKYSTQVQQGFIIASDLLLVVCKAGNLPAKVTSSALTALNFVGLVNAGTVMDWSLKSAKDMRSGIRARSPVIAGISGLRCVEILSGLSLTLGSTAAAIMGYFNTDKQTEMYESMIVWSEATLFLTAALEAAYIYLNRKALKSLSEEHCVRREVLRAMDDGMTQCNDEGRQAALIRAGMDKDTLRELIEGLKRVEVEGEEIASIFQVIEDNIRTEMKYDQAAQLAFTVAGYAAMAIEKYLTPNSLGSACINLFFATVEGATMLREATREAGQRKRFSEIFETIDRVKPPIDNNTETV